MKKVYVSERANAALLNHIGEIGYEAALVRETPLVYGAVSAHPDIYMCRLSTPSEAEIIFAEDGDLGFGYPKNIAFNAVCLDVYFIHNLKYTNRRLLNAAEKAGKTLINVRQGYSKCAAAVVDGSSVITADAGIARALSAYEDINVLRISPGNVSLPGFAFGFIGGSSGRVGDELIFSGDLRRHPDFAAIEEFASSRGVRLKYFPGYPLEDIGSIIEGI